jgi:hypothetical protein
MNPRLFRTMLVRSVRNVLRRTQLMFDAANCAGRSINAILHSSTALLAFQHEERRPSLRSVEIMTPLMAYRHCTSSSLVLLLSPHH